VSAGETLYESVDVCAECRGAGEFWQGRERDTGEWVRVDEPLCGHDEDRLSRTYRGVGVHECFNCNGKPITVTYWDGVREDLTRGDFEWEWCRES
jgi:hypothetical protein